MAVLGSISLQSKLILHKVNETKRNKAQNLEKKIKFEPILKELGLLKVDIEVEKFRKSLEDYSFQEDPISTLKPSDIKRLKNIVYCAIDYFPKKPFLGEISSFSWNQKKPQSAIPCPTNQIPTEINTKLDKTISKLSPPKNCQSARTSSTKNKKQKNSPTKKEKATEFRKEKTFNQQQTFVSEVEKIDQLKSLTLNELSPSSKEIDLAKIEINRFLNKNPKSLSKNEIETLMEKIKIISNSKCINNFSFLSAKVDSKKIKYLEKHNIVFGYFWNKTIQLVVEQLKRTEEQTIRLIELYKNITK